MANVKSAGIREVIIDRCMQERRGYSIKQLMRKVNEALDFEGLLPVTSENTIRNDLETISNRWKQEIIRERRSSAFYFRYKDPTFSIFNNQLTKAELRYVHTLLMNTKFMDQYQGCLIHKELSERLRDILNLSCYEQPLLLYENIPSEKELKIFSSLYAYIRDKQVVRISYETKASDCAKAVIHPYFLRQRNQQWHLLGRDEASHKIVTIPTYCINNVDAEEEIVFQQITDFNVEEYYASLKTNEQSQKIKTRELR